MGVLARYLDLLPAAARERVLGATHWTTQWHVDHRGARNLMGHAEDWFWPDHASIPDCRARDVFQLRRAAGDELWTDEPRIGRRFDFLVQRRGMEGALALIRERLTRADRPRPRRVYRRGSLTLLV